MTSTTLTKEQGIPAELIPLVDINVEQIFEPNGTEPILAALKAELDRRKPDLTGDTKESLEIVRSTAAQIARLRSKIEGLRKEYVSKIKELPKQIDAEGKRFRDTTEAIQAEIRKPLTDIENLEKEREERLASIKALSASGVLLTMEEAEARVRKINDLFVGFDFGDVQERAEDAHRSIKKTLMDRMSELRIAAAKEAELETLRQKQADADRAENERLQEQVRLAAEETAAANRRATEAERALAAVPSEALTLPVTGYSTPAIHTDSDDIDPATRNRTARLIIAGFAKAGLDDRNAKMAAKAIVDGLISNVEVHYV